MRAKIPKSMQLAEMAHKELARLSKSTDLRNRGVKKAPFYLLAEANMPGILIELGFLSNPNDAARLTEESYQQQLAERLSDGLISYLRAQ